MQWLSNGHSELSSYLKTTPWNILQIEVLNAEVQALKELVLTSTPSEPNRHLHPQIDRKAKEGRYLYIHMSIASFYYKVSCLFMSL